MRAVIDNIPLQEDRYEVGLTCEPGYIPKNAEFDNSCPDTCVVPMNSKQVDEQVGTPEKEQFEEPSLRTKVVMIGVRFQRIIVCDGSHSNHRSTNKRSRCRGSYSYYGRQIRIRRLVENPDDRPSIKDVYNNLCYLDR
eukprot:UN13366